MACDTGGDAVKRLNCCSLVVAVVAAACVDTGQETVTIPLRVSGTLVSDAVSTTGGWAVTLESAQLAFGPLYLCAGYQAGSLCDTARAEWTGSALVDVLNPESVDVGVLTGVTGDVYSWMYDLGITSLLTQQRPLVLDAAEALDGNSVRLEGVAVKAPHAISFVLEVAVQQEEETEIGVSVVRKSGSDDFEYAITGDEAALTVGFDPRLWVRDVDFDALLDASCAPDPGCQLETRFPKTSQGYRAVRSALVAGARPTFVWSTSP